MGLRGFEAMTIFRGVEREREREVDLLVWKFTRSFFNYSIYLDVNIFIKYV